MAEEINVKPTPIQRNILDVATELTHMYIYRKGFESIEDLQKIYTKFFVLAEYLQSAPYGSLDEFLPTDVREIIRKK